jgi:hypothetical protein
MYLTVHNQLTLLHDLLDEQVTYKTVSMNEYRQIKKLVQAMIANKGMDHALVSVLPEIYYYGIKGEIAHSFDEHITENENNIEKWLETINKTKYNIAHSSLS